jgi:alginate O-acetyltransferase complex protein AlgI
VVERLGLAGRVARVWAPIRHGYLLLVVMVGWVFFRAETLATALGFLKAMAGLNPAAQFPFTIRWYVTNEVALAMAAGILGSMPLVPTLAAWLHRAERPHLAVGASFLSTAALVALLVASILQAAARTYNPFIYFRF